MTKTSSAEISLSERRSSIRETVVLRVGVLSSAENTSFCLVKNISSTGMLVKIYGRVEAGTDVSVRVGDESASAGDTKLAGV